MFYGSVLFPLFSLWSLLPQTTRREIKQFEYFLFINMRLWCLRCSAIDNYYDIYDLIQFYNTYWLIGKRMNVLYHSHSILLYRHAKLLIIRRIFFHGRTFLVGHKTNIMCLQSKYIRSVFFWVVSRGVSTAEGWDRGGQIALFW